MHVSLRRKGFSIKLFLSDGSFVDHENRWIRFFHQCHNNIFSLIVFFMPKTRKNCFFVLFLFFAFFTLNKPIISRKTTFPGIFPRKPWILQKNNNPNQECALYHSGIIAERCVSLWQCIFEKGC